MAADLVRGQNRQLPATRLEIRVSAGRPVVAGATLSDEQGRMREPGWIAHPAEHRLPGLEVSRQAAADHRLAVDLDALPEAVHRVNVLLALPTGVEGPASFGALTPPFVAVTDPHGAELARYTITGLDAESAVVAVELYRRQDGWKVRAVGQGYAGGLAAMLDDQGLERAEEIAADINEAVAAGVARSVASPPADASGAQHARSTAHVGGSLAAKRPQDTPDAGNAPQGTASQGQGPDAPSEAAGPVGQAERCGPRDDPCSGSGGIDYQHPKRRPVPAASHIPSTPAPSPAPAGHPGQQHTPVAGDASGWSMDERLYNQVWGMFEDVARTVAAYRSAVDFAESRLERELDSALSDPASRLGPAAGAVRAASERRHAELAERAEAALDRDIAQLTAESEVVEPALPPAYARWDNPVWHDFRPAEDSPIAVRLGDLSLPECEDLRVPLLVRLPLSRGLWIDAGRSEDSAGALAPSPADPGELRRRAAEMATAIAARLIAVHPPGEFTVSVIDPAGSAAPALAPLTESGLLRVPPATGATGVREMLDRLTRRVDLVQMAARNGATSSLPPDLDTAQQVLLVHDFPHGFDDRAVTQLRYLADEGPAVGVTLMLVADREDAAGYGPVLDPLWRSLLRLTPVPEDHLADPWVGHAWTYEPPLVPPGSAVLSHVLQLLARAGR
jgi:hypothetical protein